MPLADALPDGPVVRHAAAAVQAELLAAVPADVPPALDEAVQLVRVPGEPVARDAKAEAQAELLAAVLADVPMVQDEAAPSVRVPVALVAQDARAEAQAGLLAGALRVRDEAERSVSVPDAPAALAVAELSAWIPAGEFARLGAAEPDEFPDEQMAPDDSLAFEPARDVAQCSDSRARADALRE